jgi:hypothetical protein
LFHRLLFNLILTPHRDHTAPKVRLQVAREDRRENGTYAEVTSI